MEAVIAKANIKAFCRALTCLGRIGSDLTIEQTGDSLLVFRTLSQSQSSYAQLSLHASFFDSLVALGPSGRNVRCKVNLKNLLSSLKSLAAVERLILQLDGDKKYSIDCSGLCFAVCISSHFERLALPFVFHAAC